MGSPGPSDGCDFSGGAEACRWTQGQELGVDRWVGREDECKQGFSVLASHWSHLEGFQNLLPGSCPQGL